MDEVAARIQQRKRQKALFLYSSNTGKGKFFKRLPEIKAFLEERFELESHETSSMEEGMELAEKSCGNKDVLILLGGDGTLKNIISVLANREVAPTLAYLGGGTLNDGGKNLGVKGIKSGLKILEEGNVSSFDVIQIGDNSVFYLAGMGAYMDVSYLAKRKYKKRLGRVVYYLLCIKEMFRIHRHPVKITGEQGVAFEGRVSSLAVMNGKWIGGMKTNSKGNLNDGIAEILIVRPRPFNGFLSFFFHVGFKRIQGNHFLIESPDDEPWCLDGEKGPSGPIEVVVKHNAIKAFCDPKRL